ncbi:hypothetical protein GVAV_000912 [Gurleya vavrai]
MNILFCFLCCLNATLHNDVDQSSEKINKQIFNEIIYKHDIILHNKQAKEISGYMAYVFYRKNQVLLDELYNLINPFFTEQKFKNLQVFFDSLKSYCKKKLEKKAIELKNEIHTKNDQENDNPVIKIINKAKKQMKLFEAIRNNNFTNLSIKNTKTEEKMLDFLNYHDDTTFYRYIKDFIFHYEYDSINQLYNFFQNTFNKIELKINKLENSSNFSNFLKETILKSIYNAIIVFEKDIVKNFDLKNKNDYLVFKNEFILNLVAKIFKELDAKFIDYLKNLDRDENINNITALNIKTTTNHSEVNTDFKEIDQKISFNNDIFIINFLLHFKNSFSKTLNIYSNQFVDIIKRYSNSSESLNSHLDILILQFYNSLFSQMKKFENQKFSNLTIMTNIYDAFKNKTKLSKNDIQSILNILIAESLIIYENGRFFFDFLKETMDFVKYDLVDTYEFIENSENILVCDHLRFIFYKDIFLSKNTTLNQNMNFFENPKSNNEIMDNIFTIYFSYYNLKVQKKYQFINKIFTEIDFNVVLASYDIYNFKFKLYNHIKNSKNGNYEIYQLIYYLISKFDTTQSFTDLNSYYFDIHGFLSILNSLFNESYVYEEIKLKLESMLFNIETCENEYKKYSADMIETLIRFSQSHFNDIYPTTIERDDQNIFLRKIHQNLLKYFSLCLLPYDDIVEVKNKIFNRFLKDEPNFNANFEKER